MKQNRLIVFFIVMNFFLYQYIEGCSVGQANNREWNVASIISNLALTIGTQVSSLNVLIQQDFSGSFTALQALNAQALSVQSLMSSVDSTLSQVSSSVSTILSEMTIISSQVNVIDLALIGIHVNSFGGTWTALAALQNNITTRIQSADAQALTISAFVDALSATALVEFVATATNLQVLSNEVVATMTASQALSNQITADFSGVSSLMSFANKQLVSTSAQLATVISTVQYDFAGTFTAINAIEGALLDANNRLVFFEGAWNASFINTAATLLALENTLFTISSKLDTTIALTTVVQTAANAIVN